MDDETSTLMRDALVSATALVELCREIKRTVSTPHQHCYCCQLVVTIRDGATRWKLGREVALAMARIGQRIKWMAVPIEDMSRHYLLSYAAAAARQTWPYEAMYTAPPSPALTAAAADWYEEAGKLSEAMILRGLTDVYRKSGWTLDDSRPETSTAPE